MQCKKSLRPLFSLPFNPKAAVVSPLPFLLIFPGFPWEAVHDN